MRVDLPEFCLGYMSLRNGSQGLRSDEVQRQSDCDLVYSLEGDHLGHCGPTRQLLESGAEHYDLLATVIIGVLRSSGCLFSKDSSAGSVAKAKAANVSMIKLTQSS